jgi:glutamate racemase
VTTDRPIGVFDSGMGGLSVAREIRRLLPGEDILYLADSAHCPYGARTRDQIRALAHAIVHILIDRGAKIIVVACNTVSVASLAELRKAYPVPFVGIVPAVKPAAAATRLRRVGVLATPATLQGEVFAELVRTFASDVDVHCQVCPGWVEVVERGEVHSAEAELLVRTHVEPLLHRSIDTLVLGCTHYPFLRPLIERVVGPDVTVLDAGVPVARQVGRVLDNHGLNSTRSIGGRFDCLTTATDDQAFRQVAELLLGFAPDSIERVTLDVMTRR